MADKRSKGSRSVQVWQPSVGHGRNRRQYLFGLGVVAIVLFNYPFLYVIDQLFQPPATLIALFGAWALIIAALIWIMSARTG